MLPVSQRYKNMVYSTEYARHFVPKITIQVIDTKARKEGSYTASSDTFYDNKEQLIDGITEGSFDFGTLEDFQFLLDGTKRLMPADKVPEIIPEPASEVTGHTEEPPAEPKPWLPDGQYGWCSEELSDDTGMFNPTATLTRQYENTITTMGRTYYFDASYDSVPADFDIEYYQHGRLLTVLPVRDNEAYNIVALIKADNYDRVIFRVHRTSKPFRRVHIIEDIPGIIMTWDKTQIVSVSMDQQVDVYCRELVTTELDFTIENAAKTLNILNNEGFEAYLRRRQPVESSLFMVYPDNTEEEIPLGSMKLAEWKVPKGSITASFICYDAMDTLMLSEFIKGTIPEKAVSFYELAELVLKDAGIESYTIDTELKNLYTTAPLPIASHKELLRLIAQATQSLVLPQLDGGLHIRYSSPLLVATNFIKNPAFSSGWDNWKQHDNCEFATEYIQYGKQAVKVNKAGILLQEVTDVYHEHKYYCRCYVTVPDAPKPETPAAEEPTKPDAYLKANSENISVNFGDMGLRAGVWFAASSIYEIPAAPSVGQADTDPPTAPTTQLLISVENAGTPVIVDSFQVIDLTVTYGAGKEPDITWCDKNIRFFTTQLMIPRATSPVAVDTLDYSVLIDTPEITTTEPLRSVSAKIYQYSVASEVTEVYKGIHVVAGTDTIEVRFSAFAKEVKIEVTPENSTDTATLLESTIYARAAVLKIQASANAVVVVKGKVLSTQVTEYSVDETLDTVLIPDSRSISIDNALVTNKTTAEDITGYALYWYKLGYKYDFDWRQNPALEVLDTVVVQDDFNVNNSVLLIEKTLEYDDGYLHGSSRGVC